MTENNSDKNLKNIDPKSIEEESLIPFPSRFPIKVMGLQHNEFVEALLNTIKPHDQELRIEDITIRESKQRNYLGATVLVHAESKEQLDNIYLALTSHPLVKVVL